MARTIDADKLIEVLRDFASNAHPATATALTCVASAVGIAAVDDTPKPAPKRKADARS